MPASSMESVPADAAEAAMPSAAVVAASAAAVRRRVLVMGPLLYSAIPPDEEPMRAKTPVLRGLFPRRSGRFAHDQLDREHHIPGRFAGQQFLQKLVGDLALLGQRLAHGGERRDVTGGRRDVVEA